MIDDLINVFFNLVAVFNTKCCCNNSNNSNMQRLVLQCLALLKERHMSTDTPSWHPTGGETAKELF